MRALERRFSFSVSCPTLHLLAEKSLAHAVRSTNPRHGFCQRMRSFENVPVGESSGAGSDWPFLAARSLLSESASSAVSEILKNLGARADVDRAWMFEYDEALLRFRNTHEWCRDGVRSHVEDLQDAPVTMIGWLHRFLVKGEAVMIHDVERLPRLARPLASEMLRQGDKSVLSVPVLSKGGLRACIGFDMTRERRTWSTSEAISLAACAELIGLALYSGDVAAPSSTETPARSAGTFPPLLYLRRGGEVRGVAPGEILGLRSAKDYTQVWLMGGSVVLDARPLGLWTALLPAADFLRIHRTAIVNLKHVGKIGSADAGNGKWMVQLRASEAVWSVSRPYRQALRERLGI